MFSGHELLNTLSATAVTATQLTRGGQGRGSPAPTRGDVEEPSSRRPQARALGSSIFDAGSVRSRRVREGRAEVRASVCVERKLQPVLNLNSTHSLTIRLSLHQDLA